MLFQRLVMPFVGLEVVRGLSFLPPLKPSGARSNSSKAPTTKFPEPLVVCGPSGVGKGTLITRLLQTYDTKFGLSTSHTTRKPRPGERDGFHYFFVTVEDFQAQLKAGAFIEHAEVHGNFYGTSVNAVKMVRSANRICILDIDRQGVMAMQSSEDVHSWSPKYLFIAPPSMEALKTRLKNRATETPEDLARRLGNAEREMAFGTQPGRFDKVLVNDDVDDAFRELEATLQDWYPDLFPADVTDLKN